VQYGRFEEALSTLRSARSVEALPEIDEAIANLERVRASAR
jgi:hypothetical protein